MLWGLFQEALEAMFALINEMEMAIKINTSIIFVNRAHLMGVKFNCLRVGLCPSEGENVDSLVKKYSTNMKGC